MRRERASKRREWRSRMQIHTFPSELGWMALSWKGDKLTRLTFGHPSASAAALAFREQVCSGLGNTGDDLPRWVESLVGRLQSYAAGHDERFDDISLELGHLSTFQARVVK